jgi:hypothetical protein
MRGIATAVLISALAGCSHSQPDAREESNRLRASFRPFQQDYLHAIHAANRLAPDTLRWLNGEAVTAPRGQAVAGAHMLMERWAKAHFTPRVIHEKLRFDRYSTPAVSNAHQQMLRHLRQIYVEYHDYQRYCQSAGESSMHGVPPGRLAPPLRAFRDRIETREPGTDEVTPLLDSLPR